MTRDELLEKLRTVEKEHTRTYAGRKMLDSEVIHIEADKALLAYINDPEIEEAFLLLRRWYA